MKPTYTVEYFKQKRAEHTYQRQLGEEEPDQVVKDIRAVEQPIQDQEQQPFHKTANQGKKKKKRGVFHIDMD